MNTQISSLIAGTALLATAGTASAEESMPYGEIAGNVTLASDYRFRGISQTGDAPAIQGGFDWSHDSGFYLGTWASNVSFAGSTEIDFYGGYGGEVSPDVGYDVGIVYYHYAQDGSACGIGCDEDYTEYTASMSVADATFGLVYSGDFYAESGGYYYLSGDYALALPEAFSLGLHLGWNNFTDEDDARGQFFGSNQETYLDWSVTLSRPFMGVDWAVQYNDTDLDDALFGDDITGPRAIFSVSKSF